MGRLLFRAYLGAALFALALYFAVPHADASEVIWQVFIWGAVAALALGGWVHRPSLRGPWWLLAIGLALLALGGTINLPWWPAESAELRRTLGDLASLVGYPLIGAGTAWFARAQSGGRDHGPVLDSIIVTIALTTVLWEGVFALYGSDSMEPTSMVALLVLSFSASWVAAMSTRLILAGGYRAPSGWLLFSSSVAGMSGAVAFLLSGGTGRLITGGPTDALWAAAVLLVAASAVHPSMRILTQPAPSIETANTWARILLPACALALPPAAILIRQVTTGQTATVAAVASVVIAATVVLRFADLVRARERSQRDSLHRAVRQSALARLGERGLSGTDLPQLMAAAELVLRTELGPRRLSLQVAENGLGPEIGSEPGLGSGPGIELPGSRGLVRLVSDEPISMSSDAESFASSVGHVLAAAVKRHRDEEELRHQSLHDPLTGLANRTLLDDRITKGLQRRRDPGSTVALAFVDLDDFKAVNDTHGHAVGDEVLRVVADRLRNCVRAADTVARFAGDEFVVLLEAVDEPTALDLADRILAELRTPIAAVGQVLTVTASAGLALADADTRDADDLLRAADAAMYRGKQRGRDRVEAVALGDPRPVPRGA
jgi:diguanylate cyclase (GGDEF)-like protein